MRRLLWFLLYAALVAIFTHDGKAQPSPNTVTQYGSGAPTGTCQGPTFRYIDVVGDNEYFCPGSGQAWVQNTGSGGPPTGAAGGVLSGTYPNPGLNTSQNLPGTWTQGTAPALSDNSAAIITSHWYKAINAFANPATAVQVATVTVLPNSPTYNNGAGTLTASSHAVLTIDGHAVVLNDRVLVNNQAAALQNGVYTCTTAGASGVSYVLTRASDFSTASLINNAGVIPVQDGTVNAGTYWYLRAQVVTLGTSAINYDQQSVPAVIPPWHAVGATFNGGGSALTAQVYCCVTSPNPSTAGFGIGSWQITVDDGTGAGTCGSCTATVKFWCVATGTATPTSANSISTSGVSLSTGTAVYSNTVSDFTTTTITANEICAVDLSAVANAVVVNAWFGYQ